MFPDTFRLPASRIERAGLSLTAGLLLFTGITALVTMTSQASDAALRSAARRSAAAHARALTAARGLPRVEDGRVLVRVTDAGFSAAVTDPAEPAVLHVIVPHGSSAIDCNLLSPQISVSEQSETDVRLVVSGYEYLTRAAAGADQGGSTCVQAGTASVPVRLASALDGRRVYAGNAPEATTVSDPADLPTVAKLPAGYRLRSTTPVTTDGTTVIAVRTYRAGPAALTLRIGSPDDVAEFGRQVSAATVAGHYAVVSQDGSTLCVTWNELSGRVRQLCSSAPGSVALSTPGLLAAARSVTGRAA